MTYNIKDGNDAVDNKHDDGANGVGNAHQDGPNGVADALKLRVLVGDARVKENRKRNRAILVNIHKKRQHPCWRFGRVCFWWW